MNSIAEANLTNAAESFAVANTPLFLLRKLRQDAEVQEIGRRFSGEAILKELRAAVEVQPQRLTDAVKPYAYVVALGLKDSSEFLRQAGEVEAIQNWDWLGYICTVILDTFSPLTRVSIPVPNELGGTQVKNTPETPTKTILLA